uniref:Uncharacterized protein n=1 Tax=Anguilla anguilla TaxID=7936 RepID=A0A0E9UFG5_ANGAN
MTKADIQSFWKKHNSLFFTF